MVKKTGVGCRIGSRGSPDGALIYHDDIIEFLYTYNIVIFTFGKPRPVQPIAQCGIKGIHYEGAFSASGNTGHADELSKRELNVYGLQIVLSCAFQDQFLFGLNVSTVKSGDFKLAP